MNEIEQTYMIAASPTEVWHALTNPEIIEEWSGADAEFVPEVGAEYALWDGSIVGEIVEVVPGKKLVQTWQPDNWTIENSVVSFTLTAVGSKTRVDLVHENVEDFDYEGTTEGWNLYYLGAIKRMFDAKPGNVKSTKATTAKRPEGKPTKKTAKKKPTVPMKKKLAKATWPKPKRKRSG